MIKKYLERKYIRLFSPYRLIEGVWYRYIFDEWITEDEFEARYPPILNLRGNKENSDKTKQYLYD